MPQPSLSYACGRIGVLRRGALHNAQVERLQATHSVEEANRVLADVGFALTDTVDFQTAADLHVRKACELIRRVSPNVRVTDCFLLRYDAHNLKVLLKSRHLAHKPEFLSACGVLSIDKLRHSVTEHTYDDLPQAFRQTMQMLEKKLATQFDPMLIDTELDKATYRQIFANLSGQKAAAAVRYFKAKVDFQNLIMLLRAKAMGNGAAFFAQIALEGGDVPVQTYVKAYDDHEHLTKLLKRYGAQVYQAALSAAINPKALPQLEKVTDDYLYGLFQSHRYDSASLEMLLAYLLQKQREATNVRLIMAGKLNGFAPLAVTERVRELNG